MGEMYFNKLGVMLDCSRNAVMSLTELKSFFDLLAKMGYNQFMLYTEDTYEVENEPFFGYLRGKYTIDELKEIDDYAFSKGIELVPCIQTLAHLNAIFKWEEYQEINDIDDILLLGNQRTYRLIENMVSTLRRCFRTNKIHIGLDEAHNLGKGKFRDLNGDKDRNQILLEHINYVCKIADEYGFEPMMWSDMFYRLANGGEYYATGTEFDSAIKEKIPQNLSLVYWDYYHAEKQVYQQMINGHKQLTDKIIFGGGAWKWSGWTPQNNLSIPATKSAMAACREGGIRDIFITMWGDDGAEASAYSVLPTLCVAACGARGITNDEEIKKKFYEWTGSDFDTFMLLNEPDFDKTANREVIINPSKYQLYNDCFLGIYDKGGVYEGDGRHYAQISKAMKSGLDKVGEYSYIFETNSALCDVLELKAEIGIRTRKAYKENNLTEIKDLIKDYKEMIARTERFYALFKKQWYKENKPNGFEVQSIRLGGLIMRMRDCCERLEDFCNGRITAIPELEEELMPVIEKKSMLNLWHNLVTASVL